MKSNKFKLKTMARITGLIVLLNQSTFASETMPFQVPSSRTETATNMPPLCAYLSLHNLNICFFKKNEGRQYLQIIRTKWISTKPVQTQTTYEYTLMTKVSESEQNGATWRGYQIDRSKYGPLALSERTMDLNITKDKDQYIGKLMVNGENWSGWDGYFVFKAQ